MLGIASPSHYPSGDDEGKTWGDVSIVCLRTATILCRKVLTGDTQPFSAIARARGAASRPPQAALPSNGQDELRRANQVHDQERGPPNHQQSHHVTAVSIRMYKRIKRAAVPEPSPGVAWLVLVGLGP